MAQTLHPADIRAVAAQCAAYHDPASALRGLIEYVEALAEGNPDAPAFAGGNPDTVEALGHTTIDCWLASQPRHFIVPSAGFEPPPMPAAEGPFSPVMFAIDRRGRLQTYARQEPGTYQPVVAPRGAAPCTYTDGLVPTWRFPTL